MYLHEPITENNTFLSIKGGLVITGILATVVATIESVKKPIKNDSAAGSEAEAESERSFLENIEKKLEKELEKGDLENALKIAEDIPFLDKRIDSLIGIGWACLGKRDYNTFDKVLEALSVDSNDEKEARNYLLARCARNFLDNDLFEKAEEYAKRMSNSKKKEEVLVFLRNFQIDEKLKMELEKGDRENALKMAKDILFLEKRIDSLIFIGRACLEKSDYNTLDKVLEALSGDSDDEKKARNSLLAGCARNFVDNNLFEKAEEYAKRMSDSKEKEEVLGYLKNAQELKSLLKNGKVDNALTIVRRIRFRGEQINFCSFMIKFCIEQNKYAEALSIMLYVCCELYFSNTALFKKIITELPKEMLEFFIQEGNVDGALTLLNLFESPKEDVENALDMCIEKQKFVEGFMIAVEIKDNEEHIKKVVAAFIKKDAVKELIDHLKPLKTKQTGEPFPFVMILNICEGIENFQKVLSVFEEEELFQSLIDFYINKGNYQQAFDLALKLKNVQVKIYVLEDLLKKEPLLEDLKLKIENELALIQPS